MTTVRVWLYPLKNELALSVAIISWQRPEHGYSSLRYETCSVSCHRLMTPSEHGYISYIFKNMQVVFASWQRTKHGYTSQRYESCPTSCLRLMTTVRVWLHPSSMRHALSVAIISWQRSEHGYFSLRYVTCSVRSRHLMKTVRAWKYTTHVWNMLMLMTTVRAWLFISNVWNMLPQLSSSHGYGQSIHLYPYGMKHAPSVVFVSWKRS